MGRLDCKTPSLLALASLARDADIFAVVTEDEAARAVDAQAACDLPTTPSGAAGIAALAGQVRGTLGLTCDTRVLAFVTEGPEAP